MAAKTTRRTAGGVVYELVRGKVKNFNLRVRPDGTVRVSRLTYEATSEAAEAYARRAEKADPEERHSSGRRRRRRSKLPAPTEK